MNRRRFTHTSYSRNPRVPEPTLNMEIDFPELNFTGNVHENVPTPLNYDHIEDTTAETENNHHTPGWIYGTIDPHTRKPVWKDFSAVTPEEQQYGDPICITRWINEFEQEKDMFIYEYGYDEYVRNYLVSQNPDDECTDEESDVYDESMDDDYDESYDEY